MNSRSFLVFLAVYAATAMVFARKRQVFFFFFGIWVFCLFVAITGVLG